MTALGTRGDSGEYSEGTEIAGAGSDDCGKTRATERCEGARKPTAWIEPAKYRHRIWRTLEKAKAPATGFRGRQMRKTGESSVARLGGFLNFRRKPRN